MADLSSEGRTGDVVPRGRGALAAFVERRTLVMMALGFAAGLPFLLIFDTLSAWLRDVGLTLNVIGFFSLATLVYSFKFLWAPLIDRAPVPVLTRVLGHRRSWMLLCQALIIVGLCLVAGSNPTTNLPTMALFAVLVGFCSATQDIAIDAWRIEVVDESRQGVMAGAYQWGYRGAMIVAGAVPLLLAESYGWRLSYMAMAALMVVGVLATLVAPREPQHLVREIQTAGAELRPMRDTGEWIVRLAILALGALVLGTGLAANASLLSRLLAAAGMGGAGDAMLNAWRSSAAVWFQLLAVLAGFAVIATAVLPIPGIRTLPGVYLTGALGDPLRDFFARYGRRAGVILALICVYRLSDFVLNIMNPFYLDLGFTLTQVAEVRKVFGVVALMTGVLAGGYAIARFGLLPALVVGAFGGPLSNLVFIWLAVQGHSVGALFVAIGVDNFVSGFAGTCLIAYMSSLTSHGFTATQYALFSSFYALPGRLLASQSGRIVEAAAGSADAGGAPGLISRLFSDLQPGTFARAVEQSGVSPAALGAGYVVFFIYSCVIGIFGVVLALVVARERVQKTSEP